MLKAVIVPQNMSSNPINPSTEDTCDERLLTTGFSRHHHNCCTPACPRAAKFDGALFKNILLNPRLHSRGRHFVMNLALQLVYTQQGGGIPAAHSTSKPSIPPAGTSELFAIAWSNIIPLILTVNSLVHCLFVGRTSLAAK